MSAHLGPSAEDPWPRPCHPGGAAATRHRTRFCRVVHRQRTRPSTHKLILSPCIEAGKRGRSALRKHKRGAREGRKRARVRAESVPCRGTPPGRMRWSSSSPLVLERGFLNLRGDQSGPWVTREGRRGVLRAMERACSKYTWPCVTRALPCDPSASSNSARTASSGMRKRGATWAEMGR